MLDALSALPYRQRAAVTLRYWADWTDDQIADALGVRRPPSGCCCTAASPHSARRSNDDRRTAPRTQRAGAPDELAGDPMIARMRGRSTRPPDRPRYRKPAPAPDRRRWIAVAAAAVLVAGGIAALAVNMSRDHSTVAGPLPGAGTVLTGQATIIDMGEGPKLAVTLRTSLPPQGGDIPLAGFDWSMVDDEQTVNRTTWTDSWQQITGTWDGTTFTITPAAGAGVDQRVDLHTGRPELSRRPTAQAAADAIGALDLEGAAPHRVVPPRIARVCAGCTLAHGSTHSNSATPSTQCVPTATTCRCSTCSSLSPTDATDPTTTTTGLPSGGVDTWYEIAAPGPHGTPAGVHRVLPAHAVSWDRTW